jgi:hypothetical protein
VVRRARRRSRCSSDPEWSTQPEALRDGIPLPEGELGVGGIAPAEDGTGMAAEAERLRDRRPVARRGR